MTGPVSVGTQTIPEIIASITASRKDDYTPINVHQHHRTRLSYSGDDLFISWIQFYVFLIILLQHRERRFRLQSSASWLSSWFSISLTHRRCVSSVHEKLLVDMFPLPFRKLICIRQFVFIISGVEDRVEATSPSRITFCYATDGK